MEDSKHAKCADCKHWDRDRDAANAFHRYGFGRCQAVAIKRLEFQSKIDLAMAVAVCHSEGSIEGELLTKPEFSCRLFDTGCYSVYDR